MGDRPERVAGGRGLRRAAVVASSRVGDSKYARWALAGASLISDRVWTLGDGSQARRVYRERREVTHSKRGHSQVGVVTSVVVLTVAAHVPLFLVIALSSRITRHHGLTETAFGLAFSIYFLASAAFSPAAGRIVESRGLYVSFGTSAAVAVISLIGLASGAYSVVVFMVSFVFAGFGATVVQSASAGALVLHAHSGNQGLAFGIKQAAIPLTAMISGAAVPVLLPLTTWPVLLVLAAGCCGLAFVAARVFQSAQAPPQPFRGGSELPPLEDRMVLAALTTGAMFSAIPASAGVSFLVLSAEANGVSMNSAALVLSAASLGGIIVRVILGLVADRSQSVGISSVASCVLIGGIGFASLAFASDLGSIVASAVVALSAGWGWSGLFALAVVKRYSAFASRVTGITQAGMYLGGVVGPVVFGLVVSRWGYSVAWLVTSASAGAGGGLLLAAQSVVRR